jgi:hypothetical protein
MFRIAILALIFSATQAAADRKPCLDYLDQRKTSAELAISVLVVQTNLLLESELSGAEGKAKAVMVEAANDIAEAVEKHTESMTAIMESTSCR